MPTSSDGQRQEARQKVEELRGMCVRWKQNATLFYLDPVLQLLEAAHSGDKIKLAAPVTLTDGSTCQIVTATHYRRGRQKRRCYRIEETGGLVRLSKASLAGSELLSSAKGAASPVLAEFLAGRD